LTVTWAGFGGYQTPHNVGRLPAAEHGQELVGRSEPTGPEVGAEVALVSRTGENCPLCPGQAALAFWLGVEYDALGASLAPFAMVYTDFTVFHSVEIPPVVRVLASYSFAMYGLLGEFSTA
jgi:hypothetical protein